jgi:hypothetical protein
VWDGTAAQPQRYCSPPFELPATAEISCPDTVPAAVVVGPMEVYSGTPIERSMVLRQTG